MVEFFFGERPLEAKFLLLSCRILGLTCHNEGKYQTNTLSLNTKVTHPPINPFYSSGGSKEGGAGRDVRSPHGFNFFHFHAVFRKKSPNNGFSPPPLGLAPPVPQKFWICYCTGSTVVVPLLSWIHYCRDIHWRIEGRESITEDLQHIESAFLPRGLLTPMRENSGAATVQGCDRQLDLCDGNL